MRSVDTRNSKLVIAVIVLLKVDPRISKLHHVYCYLVLVLPTLATNEDAVSCSSIELGLFFDIPDLNSA